MDSLVINIFTVYMNSVSLKTKQKMLSNNRLLLIDLFPPHPTPKLAFMCIISVKLESLYLILETYWKNWYIWNVMSFYKISYYLFVCSFIFKKHLAQQQGPQTLVYTGDRQMRIESQGSPCRKIGEQESRSHTIVSQLQLWENVGLSYFKKKF